jgi:3-oxoacyl-[acyl-carrier-protein] synthase II
MIPVISGIGVVAPTGIGKEEYWDNLEKGKNGICPITLFPTKILSINFAGEVTSIPFEKYLGTKGLRNLDRSSLFALVSSQIALEDAGVTIDARTSEQIGVCTGTTFPHVKPIVQFDREVYREGISYTNPALFPPTVISAVSSQISIHFGIKAFNTTINSGYTSGIEAIKYAIHSLKAKNASAVLAAGVDTLSEQLLFTFDKIGYYAGKNGEELSCPYDKRRNGPIFGEGSGTLYIEDLKEAKKRKAKIYAVINSVASYFDGYSIAKIHPQGKGLIKAIEEALKQASIQPEDIDFIATNANSSIEMDAIEARALQHVFGCCLKEIPVTAIKSMIGESFSAAGMLQMIASIGVMERGVIPPTINYKQKDNSFVVRCSPKSKKKDVRTALVLSFGYGGYNSACVLSKMHKI